jgi:hypothetical protein
LEEHERHKEEIRQQVKKHREETQREKEDALAKVKALQAQQTQTTKERQSLLASAEKEKK